MRLVKLNCPNCNAALELDADRQTAFCQYCGTKILIDDEVQHIKLDNAYAVGVDLERGRQQVLRQQTGKFTLSRIKSWNFPLVAYEVFIDGVPVAMLKNGQSVTRNLPVGDHYIKIVDKTNKDKIVCSENITITPKGLYLQFSAASKIKLLTKEQAAEEAKVSNAALVIGLMLIILAGVILVVSMSKLAA